MAKTQQTLKRAIKLVGEYAEKKGRLYCMAGQSWTSTYPNPKEGKIKFTAYIDGYTHVEADTVEGLIAEFDKMNPSFDPASIEEDDLLVF